MHVLTARSVAVSQILGALFTVPSSLKIKIVHVMSFLQRQPSPPSGRHIAPEGFSFIGMQDKITEVPLLCPFKNVPRSRCFRIRNSCSKSLSGIRSNWTEPVRAGLSVCVRVADWFFFTTNGSTHTQIDEHSWKVEDCTCVLLPRSDWGFLYIV